VLDKFDFLAGRVDEVQNDLKNLALEVDNLDDAIQLATSGR
jgi:hypothetical protein